jgi:hypothetical protein
MNYQTRTSSIPKISYPKTCSTSPTKDPFGSCQESKEISSQNQKQGEEELTGTGSESGAQPPQPKNRTTIGQELLSTLSSFSLSPWVSLSQVLSNCSARGRRKGEGKGERNGEEGLLVSERRG